MMDGFSVFSRLVVLSIWAAMAPAIAAETVTYGPEEVKANASMREFIEKNPDCLEFTDGCSICRKDQMNMVCSTAGIACAKRDYTCVAPKIIEPPK